ncbi:MAG: hypothetical protein KA330_00005, partial [Chitinophagaceae bacterium]|nr:hypothetical protein [Chitinophagaceae bacterium]
MSGASNIQYLTHQQIDKTRWDDCIATANNGLIYGYSFYLDVMTEHWDALVLNDYETVMPLTWKKKYGISYLYQPFLTAQLGVFGKNITEKQLETFIELIPSHFKFVEINLNSGNALAIPAGFFSVRSNYILKLDKSYKDIYQNYRENIQRNIKKAIQLG